MVRTEHRLEAYGTLFSGLSSDLPEPPRELASCTRRATLGRLTGAKPLPKSGLFPCLFIPSNSSLGGYEENRGDHQTF
jgi:hypothetical protein